MTMGINEILTAKKIILLATGENKADAVFSMLRGREDTSCPAVALRKHPDVLVILDKEAAAKLDISAWENGGDEAEEADEVAANDENVTATAPETAADNVDKDDATSDVDAEAESDENESEE